jgi:dGTPase
VGTGELELFHNRLTHSLKVAQIGRRLAERLVRSAPHVRVVRAGGIDPDVVEAACLAHDLGHPPFGHIAEKELQGKLAAYKADSFEGNAQSFRIVTKLAVRSVQERERGLNLTRATLRAILKYPWPYDDPNHRPKSAKKWGAYFSERPQLRDALTLGPHGKRSPEAEIMDIADDITYAVHDVEDFVRAGLIPLHRLTSSVTEARRFKEYVAASVEEADPAELDKAFDNLADTFFLKAPYSGSIADRAAIHDFASTLIGHFTSAVSLSPAGEVAIDTRRRRELDVLKQLTWFYVIDDPSLTTSQQGQRRVVGELFDELMAWVRRVWNVPKERRRLPVPLLNLVLSIRDDKDALRAAANNDQRLQSRTVADYISTLTEAQALNLHQRLIGGSSSGSALENWLRR